MNDEPLGTFQGLSEAWRWMGSGAVVIALGLGVYLQRVQLVLRRVEAATWWASNGRDLINALSLAILLGALMLVGFPLASACVVGATVLLLVNLVESAILARPRLKRKRLVSFAAALAVALPVLIAPESVHALASSLAANLFD